MTFSIETRPAEVDLAIKICVAEICAPSKSSAGKVDFEPVAQGDSPISERGLEEDEALKVQFVLFAVINRSSPHDGAYLGIQQRLIFVVVVRVHQAHVARILRCPLWMDGTTTWFTI